MTVKCYDNDRWGTEYAIVLKECPGFRFKESWFVRAGCKKLPKTGINLYSEVLL